MLVERVSRLPMIIALMCGGALAMLVPAIVAAVQRDWGAARDFFYSGLMFGVLTAMIALAVANRSARRPARASLVDLVATFTVLPVMLAVPLWEALPELSFNQAYFEMVSSLTTTGASLLPGVEAVPDAVHLWRALVGWLGGLLMWVVAVAILAPMSLGGFEVLGRTPEIYSSSLSQIGKGADTQMRLVHFTKLFAPIYGGLTLVLWIGLYLTGDPSLVALCHAMATLATSGISPVAGTTGASSGFGGELLIALFLVFALSRQTYTRDGIMRGRERFMRDHELRVGLALATAIPALLFLRHWVGAIGESEAPVSQGFQALWGGLFTVLSFLTTTGFESASWAVAQDWSGIDTPGLIFMGLAVMGGGVATTAGGIKLLRVYVLYRYSQREVERLVHPSAVGRAPADTGTHWKQGALIAWVFFMLFALTVAAVMLALSAAGLGFEDALVLAVAALSTTGPLAPMVTETPTIYAQLSEPARMILVFTMVLGRLETLALISVLNPDFWRR
jgi:trk system potassium uptake protein TrkH